MKQLKNWKKKMILLTAILSTLSIGCSSKQTTVFVLYQEDMVNLNRGDTFTAPADGTFFSDTATINLLKAKVKK